MSVSRSLSPRRVSFRVVIGVMRPRAQWQRTEYPKRGEMREVRGGGREENRISGGINVKGTEKSARHQEEEERAGEGEAKRTEKARCCQRGRGKDADYGVSNNHADCIFCADSFCLPPRLLV